MLGSEIGEGPEQENSICPFFGVFTDVACLQRMRLGSGLGTAAGPVGLPR